MTINVRLGLSLWLLALTSLFAGGRDFAPKLYSFDDFNKLRQVQPLERIKIYERVVCRAVIQVQRAVTMRNYQEMERELEYLANILDDVLVDVRFCLEDSRNRKQRVLRKFEISLRRNLTELSGVQKALPLAWRDNMETSIKKMFYCRRLIFNFINSQEDAG